MSNCLIGLVAFTIYLYEEILTNKYDGRNLEYVAELTTNSTLWATRTMYNVSEHISESTNG